MASSNLGLHVNQQSLSVKKVVDITKPPFWHLQQLYEFEFSKVTRTEVNENGFYCQQSLIGSWSSHGFDAYLFYYNRLPIGFCVVNLSSMIDFDKQIRDIAEFFIMPLYRRSGLGSYCAQKIFSLYQTTWEVRQLSQLNDARNFWLTVIRDYTDDNFQEFHSLTPQWDGFLQRFSLIGGEKVERPEST